MPSINSLQEHWQAGELPGLDCVVYEGGAVVLMNIYTVRQADESRKQYAFPVCDTTVDSLEAYNDDIWTEIERSPSEVLLPDGSKLVCGEGGMGNEGFVARVKGELLMWALFSTESNPFTRLEADGSFVKAFSNTGLYYKIDVDNPAKIEVYL